MFWVTSVVCLGFKLSDRRNLICLPYLHRRQPGKAVETRSAPSAQPLMLILQLGFGCPFKLYLELLSIFSWKSQVKARNSFLSGLTNKRGMLIKQTNKQTKTRIKITRHFVLKLFMCIWGHPPPFGQYVSPATVVSRPTNTVTSIHITGRQNFGCSQHQE